MKSRIVICDACQDIRIAWITMDGTYPCPCGGTMWPERDQDETSE